MHPMTKKVQFEVKDLGNRILRQPLEVHAVCEGRSEKVELNVSFHTNEAEEKMTTCNFVQADYVRFQILVPFDV